MTISRASRLSLAVSLASLVSVGLASNANADAPLPSGAHPRIWIDPSTTATMKANLASTSSAASSVVAGCQSILAKASEMQQAGIEGYNWAYSSATCALAYRLTGDATYAAPAVTLFKAMLNDYQTIGDGLGGDAVVQTDTGYGMRFYGAYSALMYDWLHDAPGVDTTLLAAARERFAAWVTWYDASGYMKAMPGSNYHAGYVFAKTLIAIAEAGEGGNDAYWNQVIDTLFTQDVIGNGLAPKGNLAGGDWPEGWEYGPMSIMEYALAARALAEQGQTFPALTPWLDSLPMRAAYGLNPSQNAQYVGGDLDDTTVDAPLDPRVLIATIAGPGSAQGAAWAQSLKSTAFTAADMCPVYDALAEARAAAPTSYTASNPALSYFAPGTRNFYARSSWSPSATWTVFTSAPRLGPDHQHLDDSSFVIEHGADALIVDPSPYGSLSTLTGNGITANSNSVEQEYQPSQGPYGSGDMAFTKATSDGVAAARAELEAAFGGGGSTSDVPLARRDWTFLPEGEVVTIDRVTTGDPTRNGMMRFRSLATLTQSGSTFSGTVGNSQVVIHPVALSAGTPSVDTPSVGDCWTSSDYGVCAVARYPVTEYALTLPGPSATAVHVIDALAIGEAAATAVSLSDTSIDPAGSDNTAVLGAAVTRSGSQTYVVASATGVSGSTMTYGVPGGTSARHVVFDAPADANRNSTVTATVTDGRCHVQVTAGGTLQGSPLIFTMSSAADGCSVGSVATAPSPTGPGSPSADAGALSAGDAGSNAGAGTPGGTGGGGSGGGALPPVTGEPPGVSCQFAPSHVGETWRSLLVLMAGAWALTRARRRGDSQPREGRDSAI